MGLIHCIYASTATQTFSADELQAVLSHARASNAANGLSGILLHVDGSFFQVLEGEAATVDAVYQRITDDPRHERVTIIIREPIARRAFAEWSMGFAEMAANQLDQALGSNDFFEGGSCLHQLSPGRAKKLLTAFATGRWRSAAQSGPRALVANAR